MLSIILILIFDILIAGALVYSAHFYGGISNFQKAIDVFYTQTFYNYLLWAAIQEGIVILIFLFLTGLRLPILYAIPICIGIFMICHFPNIVLMFAVGALAGIILPFYAKAGWIVFPVMVITHALLATILYEFFPEDFTKGFRCWFSFWNKYGK